MIKILFICHGNDYLRKPFICLNRSKIWHIVADE